jgi:hypothetical protein
MAEALSIPEPRPRSSRRRGLVIVLAALLFLTTPGALVYYLTVHRAESTPALRSVSMAEFEEETGARIVRVAVTGGGGIIDVRVQALDPDKAIEIHEEDGSIALIDEETDEILDIAFHGTHAGGTTQTGLDTAVTYYLLFANSEGALRRGDRVSLVLDGVRVEHIEVQ